MRNLSPDEVYITTVVVKGAGNPQHQHELVTQAVLAAMSAGTAHQGPGHPPRRLGPRPRAALPRWFYLALSLLFLAGAVISWHLALK